MKMKHFLPALYQGAPPPHPKAQSGIFYELPVEHKFHYHFDKFFAECHYFDVESMALEGCLKN